LHFFLVPRPRNLPRSRLMDDEAIGRWPQSEVALDGSWRDCEGKEVWGLLTTGVRHLMHYKKIIIVNPPSPPGFVANRDSMGGFGQLYPLGATILPPLDLPYLAASLLERGVPVEVIESQGLDLQLDGLVERIRNMVDTSSSQTLAVLRVALCSLDWDLSVCRAIKERISGISVAIWGSVLPHVNQRVMQESSLDYVIHNEPDD